MFKLNKELEVNKEVESILEELCVREEFNCSGYTGCPANGCCIDDLYVGGSCLAHL